jgi:hypothetical protein
MLIKTQLVFKVKALTRSNIKIYFNFYFLRQIKATFQLQGCSNELKKKGFGS